MSFIVLIFIIFCFAFCYVQAPLHSPLVIKRNGTIYKTLKPGQSTFINPFTDTCEIPKSSAVAFNTPRNVRTSNGIISNSSFKMNVPVYSIDRKSFTVYIKGSYSLSKSLSTNNVNDLISKLVRAYYSTVKYSTSPLELNKNELNILDLLREKLGPSGITIHSFTQSFESFDEFEKVDCVHYDEAITPAKTRKRKSPNFDYYETNRGAITHYTFDISDNPIRETSSITSALHNTLDNMESNVDPIDNKY